MITIAVTADCRARSKIDCKLTENDRAEDTNCRLNPLLSVRLEVRKRRIKARY